MKTILRATLLIATIALTTFSLSAQTPKVVSYTNTVNPNDAARMAGSGVIITGKGSSLRAFSSFNSSPATTVACADCINFYQTTLGNSVNLYLMAVPSAAAYYTPNSAKSLSRSQGEVFQALYSKVNSGIKIVDVYSALAAHASEDIFLRTDHHWAPLGGYYAAKELARVAGVPFKDLSNYDTVKVPNYVGSMYGYSKDASVKNSPETFVYHKPRGANYTTTYIEYRLGSDKRTIVGEGRPTQGVYFHNLQGGGAYCTFMGGDYKITQVRTGVNNGRRMLIVKDSFGNTVPGYLFYSFEEIHVVDFRYFNKNLKSYIQSNKITDVVVECNIAFACSQKTMSSYKRLLTK
jgi:hypothetical protein